MKYIQTLLLFILVNFCSAQTDTLYKFFNEDWKKVDSKKECTYYQKSYYDQNQGMYIVLKYYKSGTLYMTGSYKNEELSKREGEFIYYYPNGNKKEKAFYTSDSLTSINTFWFYNGQMMKEIRAGKRFDFSYNVMNSWDSLGAPLVVKGNGYHKDFYIDTTALYKEGNILSEKMDGIWNYYFKDGGKKHEEIWKNGKLIEGISYTKDGKSYTYKTIEEEAAFPGGTTAMMQFLMKNVRYPPDARENGIQGKVYIEFVVHKDGALGDFIVKRGVHPDLDQEALRVIKNMPKWIPGKQRGVPVSVRFVLPINFRLA